MKRKACGLFVAVFMTALLIAATSAFVRNQSIWPAIALSTLAVFNIVIWAGFGRALYDAYFRNWREW